MLARLLIAPITLYQWLIAPLLGVRCRFEPSCSHYAQDALRKHGVKGVLLTFRRILRCQPWGGHGYDPVPTHHKE